MQLGSNYNCDVLGSHEAQVTSGQMHEYILCQVLALYSLFASLICSDSQKNL